MRIQGSAEQKQQRLFYKACENCSLLPLGPGKTIDILPAQGFPEGTLEWPMILVPGPYIAQAGGYANLSPREEDKIVEDHGIVATFVLKKNRNKNGKLRSRFVSFAADNGEVQCDRSWREDNKRWRTDLVY